MNRDEYIRKLEVMTKEIKIEQIRKKEDAFSNRTLSICKCEIVVSLVLSSVRIFPSQSRCTPSDTNESKCWHSSNPF